MYQMCAYLLSLQSVHDTNRKATHSVPSLKV